MVSPMMHSLFVVKDLRFLLHLVIQFAGLILYRKLEHEIHDVQKGFRHGRGTRDHIFMRFSFHT
uniref:Uncharacterized protein n=1 Tax=Arion vulgaris TaxID=1028688 RepID=A0A0B7AVW9_9EUPU